jgi:hypothetical protein
LGGGVGDKHKNCMWQACTVITNLHTPHHKIHFRLWRHSSICRKGSFTQLGLLRSSRILQTLPETWEEDKLEDTADSFRHCHFMVLLSMKAMKSTKLTTQSYSLKSCELVTSACCFEDCLSQCQAKELHCIWEIFNDIFPPHNGHCCRTVLVHSAL